MRYLPAVLAVLALGSLTALPSAAAPMGPASTLKADASGTAAAQQVNHRWNHHCDWERGGRTCWRSRPRSYGPSIYFRFGPDRRYYREHRRYYRR